MAALVLPAIVFLVAAALVFGVVAGAGAFAEALARRRIDARLAELAAADPTGEARGAGRTLVREPAAGLLPALDRALAASARGAAWSRWIAQSGTRAGPSTVGLALVACGAAGAFVGAWLVGAAWGPAAGALAGAAAPIVVLAQRRARRLRRFEEQFPEALDLVARALRAGHAFASGLKMAAEELGEPAGPEFRQTFDEQNFGLPLNEALANLAARVPLMDVRFFATAVTIQRETGGNLAEILENLAQVVRERFTILRQVRVYTAHGRLTGFVLLALPPALAVALALINPDHMALLFQERLGRWLLGGAVALQIVGYLWIRRVVRIEV
jgi:tight adherence protein B